MAAREPAPEPEPTPAPPPAVAEPEAVSDPEPDAAEDEDEEAEEEAPSVKWLAGCDYIPPEGASDKLGFLEGDVLLVTVQHPGGWWFARLGDKEGWIPSDFMDPLPSDDEDEDQDYDDDDVAAALAAVDNAQATLVRLGSNASTMASNPQRTSGNEQARHGQTPTKTNANQSGPAAPVAPQSNAAGTPPLFNGSAAGTAAPPPEDARSGFYEDMSDAIPVDLREAAAVERRASMRASMKQPRTTAYEEMSLPASDTLRSHASMSLGQQPAIIQEDEYLEM